MMFRKSVLAITALSVVAVPAAAEARHHYGYDNGYGYQQQGYDQGYYPQQNYYAQGYYPQQSYGYDGYYGRSYRYSRSRCSGTTGTIIGAGAGALIGRSVGQGSYRRHSGTTGTILGAALGALAGREIGKATC